MQRVVEGRSVGHVFEDHDSGVHTCDAETEFDITLESTAKCVELVVGEDRVFRVVDELFHLGSSVDFEGDGVQSSMT